MDNISVAIFDFDGTLLDTHASIAQCISLTFSHYAKPIPPASTIRTTISTGAGLEETFQMLHADLAIPSNDANLSNIPNPTNLTVTELSHWISTYRSLYTSIGLPLITPFPGADSLLQKLKQKGIPVVIVNNKGIKVVEAVLKNAEMDSLVEMVLGDMLGVWRKPDPMSYFEVIAPAFKQKSRDEYGDGSGEDEVRHADQIVPRNVLIIGDTAADIQFARNIGAIACWAKYGYGHKEECEKLGPELMVDSLEEVQRLICGAD
jgi:phosphoglycolate phosphatase